MNNQDIKLFKNNDKRNWTDSEWISEFKNFLEGDVPESITIGCKIKLKPKQANAIIWYLQEHFPILPDNIEICDCCQNVYDSYSEGDYLEKSYKGNHHFCGDCSYNIPEEIFAKQP